MGYDCFISYASSDHAIAAQLNDWLTATGLRVWFDEARLLPGCDWHHEIEQHCEESRVVLPVLTPRWKLSDWTRYETYGAEAVIPLLFEGAWKDVCTPPLERFQADRMQADAFDDASGRRLDAAIRRLLAAPAPQKRERLVHLKYRANDHFVGREPDLIHIHEELHCNPRAVLTQGRVRAIAAMGGVGKTTLARQYAEKFWRCYPQMFWVDSREGFEAEFAEIHDLLFPERATLGLESRDKARRALYELQRPEPRLLVIDNAEDEQSAMPWVPKSGGCHTLITSRFAGFSEAVTVIQLDVLDPPAAVEFFHRRIGPPLQDADHAACISLADRLGFLPLALEQAAAYMKKQNLGFADYLQIYERAQRQLLSIRALGSTDYPDSVITSLHASVAHLDIGARVLLLLASILANTPIELRMLVGASEAIRARARSLGDSAEHGTQDFEVWLRGELGMLLDYSLAASDGKAFTVHPLLQTVEYEMQSAVDRASNWLMAAQFLVANSPVPSWKIDARDLWTRENDRVWELLIPHVGKLLDLRRRIPAITILPELWLLAINTYATAMDYSGALDVCRELCRFLEDAAAFRALYVEAKDCLAALLKQSDLHQEALQEFRELHALRAAEQGEDHPLTLRALHNAACLMELLGDSANAERTMRDVLERRRRTLGEESYDTIISIHDLGWLLDRHEARRDEVEPLYRRAIELWHRTLGDAYPDSRDAMKNLATHFRHRGDYKEALLTQQHLVDVTQEMFGKEHYESFDVMHNLALYEQQNGNLERARAIISDVVAGYRRYLPPDHRDMITAIQDLGTIHGIMAQYAEAEPLLREALAAYERTQGPDAGDTMRTMNNLARVLSQLGKVDEARALNLRSLQQVIADPDADLMAVRHAAHSAVSLGEYATAESLLKRLMEVKFEPASTHVHLARVYFLTDRVAEASDQVAKAAACQDNVPTYVRLRIAFLKVLQALLSGGDPRPHLALLGDGFGQSGAQSPWDIKGVLDHLRPQLAADRFAFMQGLAAAMGDPAALPALQVLPLWQLWTKDVSPRL
jgi:tetratricopeptide (TPR) repeat protein